MNETLARRFWPEGEWIGRRVRFGRTPGGYTMEVIGVVEDGKYQFAAERSMGALFRPFQQSPRNASHLLVETSAATASVLPLVRDAAKRVDPRVPILSLRSVDEHVEGSLWVFRLGAGIGLMLGLLALGLSAAGLYGVMAYVVGQRVREIGIRIALGAQGQQVVRLFVGRGLRLATIGLGLGLVIALGLGTVLSSVLFGVAPRDPVTIGGVALLLTLVAVGASLAPALLALRRDPVRSLKAEAA